MKRFICTDSLLMLPISGAFLTLLGILLIILYIVARGLTASLYYVEGVLPTYVVAILLIVSGAAMIILLKKKPNFLIYLAVAFSCVAFCLCTLQAVSVGIVSIPFLGSFSACVYHNSLSECQCYILSAKENNTGIIVPGADTEKVTFQAVRSCAVIEHNMIDCLYILCIIYGFAGIASLVTGSLSFMLLCSQRRATKEMHALQEAELSRNRGTMSLTEALHTSDPNRETRNQPNTELSNATTVGATATSDRTAPGRRATIGHHDVRNHRPCIVQRSSSTSAAHGRQGRHNSGDGTVRRVAVPQHSNQPHRQGRPPTLVRGGYLQIHVNGPSIPVYIIPGSSNEAFIALTDLPSLQLPSLDSVPAYVSEIEDLYPTDQPPPYSPTPNEYHPPTFSVIMESSSTPSSGNRSGQPQRLVLLQEESADQQREEQTETENGIPTEPAEPNATPANSTNESSVNETNLESSNQDQLQVTQSSSGLTPSGLISSSQSSAGNSEQPADPCLSIGVDVALFHNDSDQSREVSEERAEPPTAVVSNTEINHPGSAQSSPPQERPTLLEVSERLPASSLVQGARPKQRQSQHGLGEEAYLAHTRSSSPSRSSQPLRNPSPKRGSSPSRRSASPSRRHAAVNEIPSRQSASNTREMTRARSNSRGRQRQLPDILPRTDYHLQDTEFRSTSGPQPSDSSSNRSKVNHKKHHRQKLHRIRQDQESQPSSHKETTSQKPPQNPDKRESQTGLRSKTRDKQTQHSSDSKKTTFMKVHKHHSNSARPKSGNIKIEMNIPANPSCSSTESLTNILTLVESVHSSVKAKPKKPRHPSNEEKVNLVDSRV
ncbi:heat shock protein DDB_G0288861-like [Acanthaster planci]|uniref:Heat shock protein DDB_G0288861-like n=1 Tax=Acanthaster planci TaxID=133434 RepID=A0A8B7ZRV5_ACAPL|nr:heat shock protein DDB_G0288861-like [Acanthaster planci]XP_022108308.1 heat shock protein DDB_G0288861-like [Acanthaster planci]